MGKGIRIARIGELTPYLAWGAESTSNDSLQVIRSNYIKGGGMLGISMTHNLSIIGQISYYVPFGNVSTQLQDSEADAVEQDYQWVDKFEGRDGMTLMVGLRLEF